MLPFSLKTHVGTRHFNRPLIMSILNITPDSFSDTVHLYHTHSDSQNLEQLLSAARQHLDAGADILDIGGYSTRPGAEEVSADEEWKRVQWAAAAIRHAFPDAVLSVDTFRASVAEKAVRECQVDIINDISGGQLDPDMFATVAQLDVPYILTHTRGTPQTMQSLTSYHDFLGEIDDYFQQKIAQLRQLGVSDIILDPGLGFAKTTQQNYTLLREMQRLTRFGLPLLAGISHKSMIYRPLGILPSETLNGTTALNMVSLLNGADILRVHDTREAKEVVSLYQLLIQS